MKRNSFSFLLPLIGLVVVIFSCKNEDDPFEYLQYVIKATVHTHGMFATIAAMSGELLPITPPQAEFVPVGIVPFTMPGSNDVADKVVEALGEEGRAVLIKNHGMFCCGERYESSS